MPYLPFTDAKPVSSDPAVNVITDTRTNLAALRDGVTIGGLAGWSYSKTNGTGTSGEPQYIYFTKDIQIIRGALTWVNGFVTVVVWTFSYDSGVTYPDSMGTETITYDVDGNVVTVVWT